MIQNLENIYSIALKRELLLNFCELIVRGYIYIYIYIVPEEEREIVVEWSEIGLDRGWSKRDLDE